jgi:hypothetical protein
VASTPIFSAAAQRSGSGVDQDHARAHTAGRCRRAQADIAAALRPLASMA